jgi:heavy metal sensor kinase
MKPKLRRRDLRRFSRGLRFRLTATYSLFFAVILIGVVALSRERLSTTLESQLQDSLNDEWTAVKGGFLRISMNRESGKYAADWYYDSEDPDETTLVLDLKKLFLITDQNGAIIRDFNTGDPQVSTAYEDLGVDKPAQIQARVRQALANQKPNAPGQVFWIRRWNSHGEPFLIRGGVMFDQTKREPFYVALGSSFADSDKILRRYTIIYLAIIPGALILGSLLGWIMAGRALTPVHDVAKAAQRISGSNLSLRIPSREAGDELDYLIHTFNRMIERLEASFQQMKQFSTDVSHELRTPITAIRGQLEVALFTAKTTEQYREAMFNALQDIDRLSQIVRALLLLSQAESGQLVLQKSRLDLRQVLEDLAEQFQIPAEAAGLHLTADLPPQCLVEGDRVQIERMITNLLSNAIKFTPEGGHVRLAAANRDGRVEIVVEDSGRGIATEHLPYIFDRFYRVPGSGGAPGPEQGLGLGLSFVAWIVKAHRGVIDVHSVPGKGTRFTIKLPAADQASDTMELAGQPVTLA